MENLNLKTLEMLATNWNKSSLSAKIKINKIRIN